MPKRQCIQSGRVKIIILEQTCELHLTLKSSRQCNQSEGLFVFCYSADKFILVLIPQQLQYFFQYQLLQEI